MAKKPVGTATDFKSMDLSYDSTTKSLVGILTITDEKGVETELTDKKITSLSQIKLLIGYFALRDKLSVSDLITNGTINIDKSVQKNKGIIVYDDEDKQYHKFFYDVTKDQIFKDGGVVDEKTAGVSNLKVNWKAVAALGTAVVISVAFWVYAYFANKNSKNRGIDTNNGKRMINELPNETKYVIPGVDIQEPNMLYQNDEVPAIEEIEAPSYVDNKDYVETITGNINNICWPCTECDFCDLGDIKDRDALQVINNARNDVINKKNSVFFLIDDYARYIFEGSTLFDGRTIKGYDYLDSMSKYLVVVSAQTAMQNLCPRDCMFDLQSGLCNFDELMSKFDDEVNQVYGVELLNESKTL